MKHSHVLGIWVMAICLAFGGGSAYAQGLFKISFKFDAAGKKLPSGEYWVGQKDDGQILFRQQATGKEFPIPFTQRLRQPSPSLPGPQLVFDVVGNFEPSYTEYVTDYVLAEIWLTGEDGFLVHTMKGAHQTQTIKGRNAE